MLITLLDQIVVALPSGLTYVYHMGLKSWMEVAYPPHFILERRHYGSSGGSALYGDSGARPRLLQERSEKIIGMLCVRAHVCICGC